jgi:hypothetical protein
LRESGGSRFFAAEGSGSSMAGDVDQSAPLAWSQPASSRRPPACKHPGAGRVIAVIVMVVGIGFVALLTAAAAERFSGDATPGPSTSASPGGGGASRWRRLIYGGINATEVPLAPTDASSALPSWAESVGRERLGRHKARLIARLPCMGAARSNQRPLACEVQAAASGSPVCRDVHAGPRGHQIRTYDVLSLVPLGCMRLEVASVRTHALTAAMRRAYVSPKARISVRGAAWRRHSAPSATGARDA